MVFVTHALHFLSYCDYIYTLQDGRLMEQGTFQELIAANGEFARLDKEYGGNDSQPTEKPQVPTAVVEDVKSRSAYQHAGRTGKLEGKLIVKERRTTGSMSRQGDFNLLLISSIKLTFCQFTGPISQQGRDISRFHFSCLPLL